jgi:hypothetical protein
MHLDAFSNQKKEKKCWEKSILKNFEAPFSILAGKAMHPLDHLNFLTFPVLSV